MVHECSAGLSCMVCDVHEGLWRLRCSNGVKSVRKLLFTKFGHQNGYEIRQKKFFFENFIFCTFLQDKYLKSILNCFQTVILSFFCNSELFSKRAFGSFPPKMNENQG